MNNLDPIKQIMTSTHTTHDINDYPSDGRSLLSCTYLVNGPSHELDTARLLIFMITVNRNSRRIKGEANQNQSKQTIADPF
jgi:hypothetical protein